LDGEALMRKQAVAESPLKVFGGQLSFYQDRAGMTSEQLGARIFLSGSLIRKVQAGLRVPNAELVTALEAIPELGCNGALLHLYRMLEDYFRNGVYPGWFKRYADKEAAAKRIRNFQPVLIPGLGQTESYARRVLSTKPGAGPEEIDDLVAGRMARQAILDREDPPEFWSVIDEGALRRQVGTRDDMREQLQRLVELARRPNVTIQVIRFADGPHEGLRGAGFALADFPEAPTVGYQDTALAGQIIEDWDEVQALTYLWDALLRIAQPKHISLQILEELAEEWN
jgi:hypothetical protein